MKVHIRTKVIGKNRVTERSSVWGKWVAINSKLVDGTYEEVVARLEREAP